MKPTKPLVKTLINECIVNRADEILLRVSGYDWSGPTPVANDFQAIVRFADRNLPWAVSVKSDPYEALTEALQKAASMEHNSTEITEEPTDDEPVTKNKPRLLRKAPIGRVRKPKVINRKRL